MRIPVTNNGKNIMYCGTEMIPPGETRHVEEFHVPLHLRPAPAAPASVEPADPIRDLIVSASAKEVIAAIPGLDDAELKRLEELETARMTGDKPSSRKTVLAAIQEEAFKRAEKLTQGGSGNQE